MSDSEQHSNSQQAFEIQRLYLKDVSFEAPGSPAVFTREWKPETNLQLTSRSDVLGEDVREVVLELTVTTKSNDQTAYLVQIQQAGIFVVKGFPEEQLGPLLGSYCPNVLYPFAREAVADLVSKGGFPQLILAPVNFDALYAQHVNAAQGDDGQQAAPTH